MLMKRTCINYGLIKLNRIITHISKMLNNFQRKLKLNIYQIPVYYKICNNLHKVSLIQINYDNKNY